MQIMKTWSFFSGISAGIVFFFTAVALPPVAAAVIEHTFVSQMNMTHLCKETLVTVVNGQLPGPAIDLREGDSVAVHVINKSPYNITIHWHGVKQWLNCWYDGVPMITQRPILPNTEFTYRFNVSGQEGTLWWHAHVPLLRVTLHGALIIRPRDGPSSYLFPKPDKEVRIIIGEWWDKNLTGVHMNMTNGFFDDFNSASTINGKLGDLFNCSGKPLFYITHVPKSKMTLFDLLKGPTKFQVPEIKGSFESTTLAIRSQSMGCGCSQL
ncbi:hypothetical protein EJB05_26316, partial [Eragrostis curvula]